MYQDFYKNYFGKKISCHVHIFISVTGTLSLQVYCFHPANTTCILKDYVVIANNEESKSGDTMSVMKTHHLGDTDTWF